MIFHRVGRPLLISDKKRDTLLCALLLMCLFFLCLASVNAGELGSAVNDAEKRTQAHVIQNTQNTKEATHVKNKSLAVNWQSTSTHWNEGSSKMSKIKNGQLSIDDAQFWKDPWVNLDDIEFNYVGRMVPGIILDGPENVALTKRDTLPLAVFQSVADADLNTYRFPHTAILFASRKSDRGVFAAMAMEIPADAAIAIEEQHGDGFTGQNWALPARAQLNLPWDSASYIMGIVMLDRVSNRIQVNLVQGEGFSDPAVKLYTDAQAYPRPLPVYPRAENPLPRYTKSTMSPELPTDGVSINIERVLKIENKMEAVLHGSFRLKVLPGEINKIDSKQSRAHAEPTAIIPITLLITGSKSVGPVLVTVRAPSVDLLDEKMEGQYVTGYFSIDLLKIDGMKVSEETFFVYVIAGSTFEGPFPFALVSEKSLPGGNAALGDIKSYRDAQ